MDFVHLKKTMLYWRPSMGEDSVIGAGNAVGNPCRMIRKIGERDKKYDDQDRKITAEDLSEERRPRGE